MSDGKKSYEGIEIREFTYFYKFIDFTCKIIGQETQ